MASTSSRVTGRNGGRSRAPEKSGASGRDSCRSPCWRPEQGRRVSAGYSPSADIVRDVAKLRKLSKSGGRPLLDDGRERPVPTARAGKWAQCVCWQESCGAGEMASMSDSTGPTRPAPRTPAAIEAELRRRVGTHLAEARLAAGGDLTDEVLAAVIARAIGLAVGWHLESPEHTSAGGRAWRPAPGPRGRARPEREWEGEEEERPRPAPRGPRPRPPFEGGPPRPRFEGGPAPRRPGPWGRQRDFEDERPERPERPRRGPTGGPRRPPFSPGGGFGGRKPPRKRS